MQIVLEEALSFTGSPLISLVCVSIAVSLGSLPLYHMAESWQDKEREIQKKLKPKISEFKTVFRGSALNSYIGTLYRQNGYHPVFAVRTSFGLLIQIPFFFAAYHLLSNYNAFNGVETLLFKDLGKPDSLITVAGLSINVFPFLMTAVNLISASIYGKKTTFKENLQLYGMALLFLVVLYDSASSLLFYWTFNNIFSLLKNLIYNRIYDNGIIKKSTGPAVTNYSREHLQLLVFALISLSVLIFFSSPLALLSSGSNEDVPGTFSSNFNFMLTGFSVFIIAMATFLAIIPAKTKPYFTLFFTVALFLGVANTFVFNPDYGEMTGFVFENNIEIDTYEIILNSFSFAVLTAAVIFLFIKKIDMLITITRVVLISLIIFSTYNAYAFYRESDQTTIETNSDLEKEFTFSKTGKNVVIIMLDRFIGGYVPEIPDILPEMENILDGFVWYSDTLSPGSDTVSGKPCIFGGWEYHGKSISETRKTVPLLEKMSESVRIMPYNFIKTGFDATIFETKASWVRGTDNKFIENGTIKSIVGKHTDIWLKSKEVSEIEDDSAQRILTYSIFRCSPSFLRNFFYDSDQYRQNNGKKKEAVKHDGFFVFFRETNKNIMKGSIREWSTFDLLPELSEALDNVKDQFFYFSTMMTHEPFLTDMDLDINLQGNIHYPYEKYGRFNKSMNSLKHLYTDAAAIKMLGDWFKWMKENGVYDNTRIILVSDHGRGVYNPMFNKQIIPCSKKNNSPAHWHSLLMVKDFNSSGKLAQDKQFMSTCDVSSLAMKNIVDGVNPYTGNAIKMPENKFPYTVYKTKFRIKEQGKYNFTATESFIIKNGDIFNLSNWSRID
ncbi:YidC/Oxa1 family membrane protein insertase [bacterium]|nr:YidC/Oxa1 family membrane protein insertase [bacterium]